MKEEIIIAGSGGQGVLTLGMFLVRVGILEGMRVTWLPSYGAEKRGGFSFCEAVISDEEIYSPVVDEPNTLILLDQRAVNVYGKLAGDDTLVIENLSLAKEDNVKKGKKIIIPAGDIAQKTHFMRAMNIVTAGAYIAGRDVFEPKSAYAVLGEILKNKAEEMLEKNIYAFDEGMKFAKQKLKPKN